MRAVSMSTPSRSATRRYNSSNENPSASSVFGRSASRIYFGSWAGRSLASPPVIRSLSVSRVAVTALSAARRASLTDRLAAICSSNRQRNSEYCKALLLLRSAPCFGYTVPVWVSAKTGRKAKRPVLQRSQNPGPKSTRPDYPQDSMALRSRRSLSPDTSRPPESSRLLSLVVCEQEDVR